MKQMLRVDEKVMEVPKAFLEDVSDWLYKVIAGNLAYCYYAEATRLQLHLTSKRNYMDDAQVETYNTVISKFLEMYRFLIGGYTEQPIVKSMNSNDTLIISLDMSRYKSKYGDLSKVKDKLKVKYSPRSKAKEEWGAYFPATKNIIFYPTLLSSSLYHLLGRAMNNDGYLIKDMNNPEDIRYHWLLSIKSSNIRRVLEFSVESTLKTLEHEFIHLIQDFLFSDVISDTSYDSTNREAYFVSPLEINPQLMSSLDSLVKQSGLSGRPVSKEFFSEYIARDEYFLILKRKDKSLYQKMVNAFYQLVVDRIGFTK